MGRISNPLSRLDNLSRKVRYLLPGGKYAAEIDFWKESIKDYAAWYQGKKADIFGTPPPAEKDKVAVTNLRDSAILTWANVHQKTKYLHDLDLKPDTFKGMKLLDIGAGPIPSATCFTGADLYCLDPLLDQYVSAGFPLHYWGNVKFIQAFSEDIPMPDGFFDAVISVNAIDHVDSLAKTSEEIRRVLKKDGRFAMHVHYHKATTTEPLEITDEIFQEVFSWVAGLKKVKESGSKMGWNIPQGETYVLWRNF